MSDPGAFLMGFGKHKGRPLSAIPAAYLVWVLENVTNLYPATRAAIQQYLHPAELPMEGREPEELARPASAPINAAGPAPRRAPARSPATPKPPPATCIHCGGIGTPARPLVHRECASAEPVPF